MRNYAEIGDILSKVRVREGPLASDERYGMNGAFVFKVEGGTLYCIVSDGMGWEHVSAHVVDRFSQKPRVPTWDEMCKLKDIFWQEDECVVQFHPPKSMYVNTHPHVLHLWRPIGYDIRMPPTNLVGVKGIEAKL